MCTIPKKRRTASSQTIRNSAPACSPSEYYRRTLSIPFLDHLIAEMSNRFSEKSMVMFDAFHALPSNVVCEHEWKANFREYLTLYEDDLPEPRFLETEMEMWEKTWKQYDDTPPSTLKTLLTAIDRLTFPNIFVAFQILATLPVTSCSCERSISVLRRLKTYLRSTMSEQRMRLIDILND
eukprot:gene10204-11253_t